MEDELCTYLKPETVERLQEHAHTHRRAHTYLALLRLSAFLLSQAKGMEAASAEQADRAVLHTMDAIHTMFPCNDGTCDYGAFLEFSGDMAITYFQRFERVTQAGKTALLLRLNQYTQN